MVDVSSGGGQTHGSELRLDVHETKDSDSRSLKALDDVVPRRLIPPPRSGALPPGLDGDTVRVAAPVTSRADP